MAKLKCEVCNGTAKYTLGFIERTCDVCGGTGDADEEYVPFNPLDYVDAPMPLDEESTVHVFKENSQMPEPYKEAYAKEHVPRPIPDIGNTKKNRGRPRKIHE